MKIKSVVLIICLSVGVSLGEQITIPVGKYHTVPLLLSGTLSYHVGGLTSADRLTAVVAPTYCVSPTDYCEYYSGLSSYIDRAQDYFVPFNVFDLPNTTYKAVETTQLFLFITNHNARTDAIVLFTYINEPLPQSTPSPQPSFWPEWVHFITRFFLFLIEQIGQGTSIGIVAIILLVIVLGLMIYGCYILFMGCGQTHCMTRKAPSDQPSYLYSRIEDGESDVTNDAVVDDVMTVGEVEMGNV